MQFLESALGDSAGKHETELRAAHARLDQISGKIEVDRKSLESHMGSWRDIGATVQVEKEKAESHKASIEERLSYLEKDMEKLRDAHSKQGGEAKAQQVRHASFEERLDYIDSWLCSFKPR